MNTNTNTKKILFDSEEWFRSTDLRVMSPSRFHCATPLCTLSHLSLLIVFELNHIFHSFKQNNGLSLTKIATFEELFVLQHFLVVLLW